jgi:stage II sporulation protein D
MMRGALVAVLACALAGWGAPVATPGLATEALRVRVGIVVEGPAVRLAAEGPVTAVDAGAGAVVTLGGETWTAFPDPTGIAIGDVEFGPVVRLSPQAGFLRVNGRVYRGLIELRHTPRGRLTAVNEVELEAYLYGVIKGEIDPRWPPDAVKAQAVASRTLAVERLLTTRERSAVEGYDLPATTDAQVYLGVTG